MTDQDAIYYDYKGCEGINAYSRLWSCIHIYFRTMGEFQVFCRIDFPKKELIEITDENYESLRLTGLFNGLN